MKYLSRACLTWFCSLVITLMVCSWCMSNLTWSWIILCAIRLSVFWFSSSSFAIVLKPRSTWAWPCNSMSTTKILGTRNITSEKLIQSLHFFVKIQNIKPYLFDCPDYKLVILWFCLVSNSRSNGFRIDEFGWNFFKSSSRSVCTLCNKYRW